MSLEVRLSPEQLEELAELIAARVRMNLLAVAEASLARDHGLELLTVTEVAALLKCEEKKVYALAAQNPAHFVKVGREWRISRPALEALLDGRPEPKASLLSGRTR